MQDQPSNARLPGRARLPLIAATLIALVGVGAFAVAVAAGHQPSPAGAATPVVSTAAQAPSSGWAAPGAGIGQGSPGWMGPRGGRFGGGPMAGDITITAISGTQLSLKTADGWTRTIDASGATVTRGGQTVALATLQVGDQITFRQTRQSDGTFKIDSIAVVQPRVDGTVSAVGDTSLAISQPGGTSRTVQLTSTTTYTLAGQPATKSAVTVGVQVAIVGTVATDGTFTASAVQIMPAVASGTVSAKTSSTITIKDRSGTTVTIDVGSSTTYQVGGTSSPTLSDVPVGATIQAEGTRNADGSLTATLVRVLPAGQPGRGPEGGWGMRGMWGGGQRDGQAPVAPPAGSGTSSGTSGA